MGYRPNSTSMVFFGIALACLIASTGLLCCAQLAEGFERRAVKKRTETARVLAQKKVVVENKGPVQGLQGVAEVVTSGAQGTKVEQVATAADGAAVVSTASQGLAGKVEVAEGETAVITSEQPAGESEQVNIVRRATASGAAPTAP